jgi:hypothetical protein
MGDKRKPGRYNPVNGADALSYQLEDCARKLRVFARLKDAAGVNRTLTEIKTFIETTNTDYLGE